MTTYISLLLVLVAACLCEDLIQEDATVETVTEEDKKSEETKPKDITMQSLGLTGKDLCILILFYFYISY